MHFHKLKNLLVGAALLGPTACATVGGTRQAISIDSSPRGFQVAVNSYVRESDPKTPFTEEVSRGRKLHLVYHSGDFTKKRSITCDFRYGTVLIGNGALAALSLASPPLAAALLLGGIGTDFISGSAFDCPQRVNQEIQVPEAVETDIQEKCNNVLILPPRLEEDDLSLSYALIAEAQDFVKRFDKQCPTFVSSATTVSALKRSSVQSVLLDELFKPEMEKKLVQVIRDTNANRVVDMKTFKKNQGESEVEFSLRDLYSKTEISTFKKVFPLQKIEKLKGGWISRYIGKSLRLVPNSFALSTSVPALGLTKKVELSTTDDLIHRDSFIGMLSLTSVQHPDQYANWDAVIDIGPSIFFDSIRNRITFDPNDEAVKAFVADNPEASKSFDFNGYALNIPMDAMFSFHTPAGAFRLFGGAGVGLYKSTSREAASRELQVFPNLHLGTDWVGYATRNLFVQMGGHLFGTLGKKSLDERQYFGLNGWLSFTIGAGYFFPDTQGYLESLFAGNP
ncbi:MAG: hypothetical protein ACO3A4_00610 [Silvanigrellaceae bacterium]